MLRLLFISLFFTEVYSKIYFKEEFKDDFWEQRWIYSEHTSKDWGKFILSPGKYSGDLEISKGIQTSENAKFYGLSTIFEPFSNRDKLLVIQFTVRNAQDIKCGGGYIKLFDCSLKPKNLHAYTPYLIMFGPDICGSDKTVQVIFNYEERRLKIKRDIRCKDDHLTHLYTLIVKPDNTYVVKIDNNVKQTGRLEDDWDFLPPERIKDPATKKSTEKSFDSTNYNETSNDTLVEKLDDTAKLDLYKYDEICGIGFDLWQVKAGTIFDNILISDDEFEAEKHGEETWGAIKEKEKKLKSKIDKAAADEDVIPTDKGSPGTTKTIRHDEF